MIFSDIKVGDKVVRISSGPFLEVASIKEVAKVNKKKRLVYLDADHIEDDGVSTYRMEDGYAVQNYIPGFSSRIVILEE